MMDERPVHQPECFEAPIPGRQWYSACSPDRPRVDADGTCPGCGEHACPECGRERCPDHAQSEWGERCDVCGWCATPGRCVWSVSCPRCEAARGQQCRTPGTTRLEGLHQERWTAAGLDYRASTAIVGGDYVDDPPELPAGEAIVIIGDVHIVTTLIKAGEE